MTRLSWRVAGVAFALAALPAAVAARDKYDARPLTEAATAALRGKRLAVARNELPDVPLATGDRQDADWRALRDVRTDPADLFERELAPAIAREFGMSLRAGPGVVLASRKPEALAAALPDADYVLDILVTDRRNQNTPDLKSALRLKPETLWLGLGVRIQLENRETGRAVFSGNCYADTFEHPHPPEQRELAAHEAKLFRAVFEGLAWRCLRTIARYVPLEEEALPETPGELVDPLGEFAAKKAAPPGSS